MKPISNVREGYANTIAYSLKTILIFISTILTELKLFLYQIRVLFSRSSLKEMLTKFIFYLSYYLLPSNSRITVRSTGFDIKS